MWRSRGRATLAAAIALTAIAWGPALAQTLPTGPRVATIRAASSFPADHVTTEAMERLASSVASTTSGQLRIEVVPEAGSVEELARQLETGDPAIILVDLAAFSSFAPELRALALPFLMPSRQRAFEIVEGPVVDLIEVWLQRRNFVVLGYMDAGTSPVFTTSGPLQSIEDLEGLSIGVGDEMHAEAWALVGAEPVVMPAAEAIAAVQGGELDAAAAPYQALLGSLPAPAEGYIAGIVPIAEYAIIVANRERWNNLVLDHQRITELAARNAVIYERGASSSAEQAARAQLESRGLVFEAPSGELQQQLWQAAADLVEQTREEAGAVFVDGIIAEARGAGGEALPVR